MEHGSRTISRRRATSLIRSRLALIARVRTARAIAEEPYAVVAINAELVQDEVDHTVKGGAEESGPRQPAPLAPEYSPGFSPVVEEEIVSVTREGGCSCRAVRYRLTSDPLFTHCCHCLNCQRQTGSAFVVNLLIEADRVEVLAGDPQPVDAPRDDGSTQRIFRCPTCQVAVFSQYGRPEVRFVRGGTLDDPASIAPDVHIFTRSKLGWVALPESIPAFEVYYDPKALWPAASLQRLRSITARGDPEA